MVNWLWRRVLNSNVMPMFFKSTTQKTNLKYFVTIPNCKFVITPYPLSFIKVNTSPKTSFSLTPAVVSCPYLLFLLLVTIYKTYHQRKNYGKLTSHYRVRFNVISYFPPFPLYATHQSQRPRYSHFSICLCYLYGTTSHLIK